MIKLLLVIHGVYSMYYVWCKSSKEWKYMDATARILQQYTLIPMEIQEM